MIDEKRINRTIYSILNTFLEDITPDDIKQDFFDKQQLATYYQLQGICLLCSGNESIYRFIWDIQEKILHPMFSEKLYLIETLNEVLKDAN